MSPRRKVRLLLLNLTKNMTLKLFRQKKKTPEDLRQRMMSYLCSPEEFNNSGSIDRGSSKIPEDLATSLIHPLDTESPEAKMLSTTNVRNLVTIKMIVPNF